MNDFIKMLDFYASWSGVPLTPCGSRVTCEPPPTDTDIDYLGLVPAENWLEVDMWLLMNNWSLCGSHIAPEIPLTGIPADTFRSYRHGSINLILTPDKVFFDKFMAATSVAKRLNLLDKSDRVALFQAVLYGAPCEMKPIAAPTK